MVVPAAMTFLGEGGLNKIGWNASENEVKQCQHHSRTLLEGPRLGYIILHCKLGVILELLFFIGRVDTIFVVPYQ